MNYVFKDVISIIKDEFLNYIQYLMLWTRNWKLPEIFNLMIMADLFLKQLILWEMITWSHINRVWKVIKEFLSLAATYITDAAISKTLFQKIFEFVLNQLLKSLNVKTSELLMLHQKSHSIIYNHYFTEILQKVCNK